MKLKSRRESQSLFDCEEVEQNVVLHHVGATRAKQLLRQRVLIVQLDLSRQLRVTFYSNSIGYRIHQ
jgi:hypothetical protein